MEALTIFARDSDTTDRGDYSLLVKGTVYDSAGLPVAGAESYENLYV